MIREILALLLIVLLAAGSIWNIHTVDKLCSDIQSCLSQAETQLLSGHREAAEQAVNVALETWQRAERHTHIFIRHPEIDSCTDIFYDLKEALESEESAGVHSVIGKLRCHLESIADMEKPKLGNIL